MQQGDVPVQVLLPVVLGVDDDSVDHHDLLDAPLEPDTGVKTPVTGGSPGLAWKGAGKTCVLGPVVFAQADQDVRSAEVLVPGWVQDAVGCSEDPLVTDQTGSAQQLLRAPFVQHHLPAGGTISASSWHGQGTSLCCGRQGNTFCSYHGAEATSASSPPTMRFSR